MERLLLLRLRAVGCAAEARVNDVPVLRLPAGGGNAALPVHEYLTEGDNTLQLVVEPGAAAPRLAAGPSMAALRLLLPRCGQPGSELSARGLAELDWAAADGEVIQPSPTLQQQLVLPAKLPRWRWFDAPPLDDVPGAQPLVAAFVQQLALSLAQGDPEPFLSAARVRFEDLALAYQQPVAELAARWRSRIEMLAATKALKPVLPALADVQLLPCAGGRLLEPVLADGEPALRTEPAADGTRHVWPIRIAVVEGRCHVVR